MNKAEVEQKVKEITADVLNVDVAKITPRSTFTGDLGAESIQSIQLVAAYEEGFDIEMDEDEALSVKNVGDAIEFIHKVVQAQHG
ncbi:MAG: Acyl carrier protein AcpP [Phycisphaerae bacterium]|nr:Acyl carrier protein AcpP [Phycisphaerae bacterium]